METRVDKVAEKHKSGYNCAQAVACAYCDLIGIDEETMFRLTEGLGLGMGGMEGTCGAVTAALPCHRPHFSSHFHLHLLLVHTY